MKNIRPSNFKLQTSTFATRREVCAGLAALIAAGAADAAGLRRGLAARMAANFNGEDEEEMYKELYKMMVSGLHNGGTLEELVDDVSTQVRQYAFNGVRAKKIRMTAATGVSAYSFGNNAYVEEIHLPNVVERLNWAAYVFTNATALKILSVPKMYNLGTNSLAGCTSLEHVYMTDYNFSQVSGSPWGCPNANTVFHFKDGDRDKSGTPVV